MKCRLCDRPTPVGNGKLCLDCTKALHRARGATARKLASSQTEPVTASAIDLPLAAVPAAREAHPWKHLAVWATISVAVIAIVYFGQRELTSSPGTRDAIVDRSPLSSAAPPTVEAAAFVSRVEEPSWTALGNAIDTPGSTAAPRPAAAEPVKSPVPAAVAGPKAGSKSKNTIQDSKTPSNAAAFVGETPAQPEEAPQQLARASVPPPQPADGPQVLASAMEKCGKEGLLSKFICEQKTYMQYCEDKWDKDPRCMRKTASN